MSAPFCQFAAFSFAAAATLGTDVYGQVVAPPHHTPDGFRNNHPHEAHESFWLWKWEQLRHGVPPAAPGGWKIPVAPRDPERMRRGSAPAVTWIGHSSFLLQLAGGNVLIDPQFSERASPVSFAGPR